MKMYRETIPQTNVLLSLQIGVESFETTTRRGVPLTINKPSAIVKQEIAHPIVIRHLRTQVQQLSSGMISELYQSEKWTSDPFLRTPMIKHRSFDNYLEEYAKLRTGEISLDQTLLFGDNSPIC
ncbi:hypothetical protein DFS34DRAFT_590337 [Phlyctochytrium arcticum]|nr:hypothetical protein DFS34DRAFT_590337 [Phlyctochytrium arcticum]